MEISDMHYFFDGFIGQQGYVVNSHVEKSSLKTLIKKHLEQLLNVRRPYFPNPKKLALTQYGLPDLSQFNPHSEEDCLELCQSIQNTIELFESRLTDVQVNILDTEEENNPGTVSLKLSGHLKENPAESIEFISWLNPVTYKLWIEEML